MPPGGSLGAFSIVRPMLPLLLAIPLGCAMHEVREGLPGARPQLVAPAESGALFALASLGEPGRLPSQRDADERSARGIDLVRIARSWKTPMANGSTGFFLDVFNAGSRSITGLVLDLDFVRGERRLATGQTCQLGVFIPAGRVGRVVCYKPVADPDLVVPRIVDVFWR